MPPAIVKYEFESPLRRPALFVGDQQRAPPIGRRWLHLRREPALLVPLSASLLR